ncbi:DNA polymerase-3 subunit epsilon [Parabacteroides sp. PFB2-10]|uniref:3'-5' exonuclease n=1 Tax=Parabacteroides sp. PFB2-10 TaxID=1742405 RepID=UPI0024755E9C|nr:3'-5' exonuclease [Parabacteroides sp. PFB2-10]MDH6312237.1 DNA polymerase-3 subunit epsilon [Parabacteroides sp. PFB2-10]
MKLLFFDLETTGIKYWRNGIHQISGEVVIDGETKESFNFKVQPHPKCDIEEDALKVCNVTREQIMAYPPMREVYAQLINMLGKYVDKYDRKDKFFLVGYNNASFDNYFLKAFFVQNDDQFFYSWFWVNSIDIMVLATHHLMEERCLMPDFKLETVARKLGIEPDVDRLHDAAYDIELTKMVYHKLGKW